MVGVAVGDGFGDVFGVAFGVPPSIVHEYPVAAGFPSVVISSGVATLEVRKPVSSNRPPCCDFTVEAGEEGLPIDKGLTRLSLFLFGLFGLSANDNVFLWLQDGLAMFGLAFSNDEGLRSTMVAVGDTRLISTVSADEILRSVQMGGEVMLSLIRLALESWQLSISGFFGGRDEDWPLLVSVMEISSGR